MKKLLLRILLLIVILVLPYCGFQYWIVTKFGKDYFMLTHKSESVITGLSRAKRISPYVLQEELFLKSMPQNLAYSNSVTPYGAYYLSFLKKKLIKSKVGSIHIVCVSPASIMDLVGALDNGRETYEVIYNSKFVNSSPNIEYLWNQSAIILLESIKSQLIRDVKLIPHKNGWLEVILGPKYEKNKPPVMDQKLIQNSERIDYLKQTIDFLKTTGKIYMVRMPISNEMVQMEDALFPGFNEMMQVIANDQNAQYFDYSNTGHLYEFHEIPGHHMDAINAQKFTKTLAIDIKQHMDSSHSK
ncbi:MAG: ABC-type molybdate transport system substrate-binding protein [Roseivirga sp.]|jgi:ABC-type molybdate transport system substrate-binding protein